VKDVYTFFIDGWAIAVRVPNGDLSRAQICPYSRLDQVDMTAAGVVELLRSYEQLLDSDSPIN
jgi:hypothetical protein